MGILRAILDKAAKADFSVLGNIYLGPSHFLKVGGVAYLGIMAAGAAIVLAVLVAWVYVVRRTARAGGGRAAFRLGAYGVPLLAVLAAYVTLVYPPTTDEPHYLVLTESLLRNGDLKVGREYSEAVFTKFYPAPTIDAHAVITQDGEMYSQHTVGLPALILLPYAVGGRWGVALLMAVLAALLAAALYGICRQSGVAHVPATAAAGLRAVSIPGICTVSLVFTELPAAWLVAAALQGRRKPWLVALCAAALPWLHPRYAVLSGGLFLLTAIENGLTWALVARWAACLGISGAGFLAAYHGPALVAILNVITEKYPSRIEELSGNTLSRMAFANPLAALAGKLLDRDFGLLPFAPIWLAAFPGAAIALRTGNPANRAFLAGALPYLAVTCMYRNWGGSAFPGRTLVPLIPFLVPYLGLGLGRLRQSLPGRVAVAFAIGLTLWTSFLLTACPVFRYTSGREWLEGRMGSLAHIIPATAFPSLAAPAGALLAVLWSALGLLLLASYAWTRRAKRR